MLVEEIFVDRADAKKSRPKSPQVPNHGLLVFARQFNMLLEETELKMDTVLQTERTIYKRKMRVSAKNLADKTTTTVCKRA